jgi:hypothetical protein
MDGLFYPDFAVSKYMSAEHIYQIFGIGSWHTTIMAQATTIKPVPVTTCHLPRQSTSTRPLEYHSPLLKSL